jgi:heme oxygenase
VTLLFESVRTALVERVPEVAAATCALCIHAGHTREMWDALGPPLDRVARTTAVEDRVVQGAHDAFRTLIAWHRRASAPARASARA